MAILLMGPDAAFGVPALQKASCDGSRQKRIGARLGDAVIDPVLWPPIIDEISFAESARNSLVVLPCTCRGEAGLGPHQQ